MTVRTARRLASVAGPALALLLAGGIARADDLAPWRALAMGPAGRRLLAIARAALASSEGTGIGTARDSARAGLAGAGDSAAGADSGLAWPPPPAALYLTLTRGAASRACVGHESPLGADVAEAVRALAPRLLTGDRRRPPVRADELKGLRLVIGFAGVSEPVADPMQVDPGREGLRIETDRGAVAFLPGEARTVDWALREARRIGVLSGPRGAARYFRFSVVTLSEAAPPPAPVEDVDVAP